MERDVFSKEEKEKWENQKRKNRRIYGKTAPDKL
jgi:hypothetical protein